MKFSEWLKLKEMTSTASVANFVRPVMSNVRRNPVIEKTFKKNKKKVEIC